MSLLSEIEDAAGQAEGLTQAIRELMGLTEASPVAELLYQASDHTHQAMLLLDEAVYDLGERS